MNTTLRPVSVEHIGGPFDGLKMTMPVPLSPVTSRAHITADGAASFPRYQLDAGADGQPVFRTEPLYGPDLIPDVLVDIATAG